MVPRLVCSLVLMTKQEQAVTTYPPWASTLLCTLQVVSTLSSCTSHKTSTEREYVAYHRTTIEWEMGFTGEHGSLPKGTHIVLGGEHASQREL